MTLTARDIFLRKASKVLVAGFGHPVRPAVLATFSRNLESLGFIPSPALMARLADAGEEAVGSLLSELVPALQAIVGADRPYTPMYPGFPLQVMEADEAELYFDAYRHNWGSRASDMLRLPIRWMPAADTPKRAAFDEAEIPLRVIDLGTEEEFEAVFTRLVGANTSLSVTDRAIVRWFVTTRRLDALRLLPELIPQKQTRAMLVAWLAESDLSPDLASLLTTATDVLRVAVVMSGGDVSLAEPTRFRRFRRAERRFLLDRLERLPDLSEEMLRRPEMWKRLGRELRPGDYATRYPRALAAWTVVRSGEPYTTFAGLVEADLRAGRLDEVTGRLTERPGELARRLDHLLRLAGDGANRVIERFETVVNRVATPVLLQMLAHFRMRDRTTTLRACFPQGDVGRIVAIKTVPPPLRPGVADRVGTILRETLVRRFSTLPTLGRVFIEETLRQHYVPTARRSAAKSLRTLGRGSRLDLPDASTLRLFLWWKEGQSRTDIDLSAGLFDQNWRYQNAIWYGHLRWEGCVHSGDITSAPNGAAEFVDLDILRLLAVGVRYVVMSLTSFTRQPYCDLPECFAGWMARRNPQSGEIFDPRTVQDRIDLASRATVAVPLIFDLVDRQAIWADVGL